MSLSRFSALETVFTRPTYDLEFVGAPSEKISDFFGSNVFNDQAMEEYLSKDAYKSLKRRSIPAPSSPASKPKRRLRG